MHGTSFVLASHRLRKANSQCLLLTACYLLAALLRYLGLGVRLTHYAVGWRNFFSAARVIHNHVHMMLYLVNSFIHVRKWAV